MVKVIGNPTRYIQGKGELKNLASRVSSIGKNIFVIIDAQIRDIVQDDIKKSALATEVSLFFEDFQGECCDVEISRIGHLVSQNGYDVIVGVGGGKTHDTAKAVAHYIGKPVVIVPTIASTDAPCSSLSVIYTENGTFDRYLYLPTSPNMVIVDTDVVSKAPVRLLVAGIGDALATYFEARACQQSDADNCLGGKSTKAALALAELCYETLLEDGYSAVMALQAQVCTKAVENIIEANTYLSGIGFESGGLAAAHAVHNGMTAIEETHQFYHGEKVAFGTLVQLVLENAPMEEIEDVIHLCQSVGLPTTLAQFGIKDINPQRIMEVAQLVCAEGETIYNMPFQVTPEDVYAAILGADELGKAYQTSI